MPLGECAYFTVLTGKARKLTSIGRTVDSLSFGWHSNKRASVMQDGYMQLRGAIRDKKTGAAKQGE